jgi:hypothetical protein
LWGRGTVKKRKKGKDGIFRNVMEAGKKLIKS